MRKINKKMKSQNRLIKTIITFFCYFAYSQAFTSLFGSSIAINFIADILFLIGIIIAYKDNLKEDIKDLKENYKLKKLIKTIISWVVILFVFNIMMGALTELLTPNAELDSNTEALHSLSNISIFYTLFKTMIFGTIAEELLFRESVHDVIKNKWLFIFVSSVIYTLINFAWTGFTGDTVGIDILVCFLPALIFSYAYYKNNSNIFILIFIKFVYNIIPVTLMFLDK